MTPGSNRCTTLPFITVHKSDDRTGWAATDRIDAELLLTAVDRDHAMARAEATEEQLPPAHANRGVDC